MTVHLVTFSDESMSRARDLCVDSAIGHGVDGITWAFAATDADKAAGRGLGFWAWKPRIILDFLTDKTDGLAHPEEGDTLIYADAGIEFIAPVQHITDRMDWYGKPQNDVWLFGNSWEHAHWCKRDVVEAVWPGARFPFGFGTYLDAGVPEPQLAWLSFGKQCQASVIFFRVSDYSRKFVKEWLDWCLFEGGRLIDDSPSRAPNHPEFREHRHDQAILTTLAYREGIPLHYWPARYNMDQPGGGFVYEKLPEYAGDDYPPLFHHHRKRNPEF